MRTNTNAKSSRQIYWLFACCLSGTWILAGCLTVEQMAPPVGPQFSRIASSDVSLAVMKLGRDVYIQDCTRCHSIEPIDRYTEDRWRDIIDRMGLQSKLDESRIEALRSYILVAHNVMTQPDLTN